MPERVLNKSFVVLSIRNSKANHLGAQGTLNLVCLVPLDLFYLKYTHTFACTDLLCVPPVLQGERQGGDVRRRARDAA